MSDVEIEQIRGANPFPDELPAPPIELVLQRLERDGGARSARRRREQLPSLGAAVAAASVLLTATIAVLALTELGHHAHPLPPVHPVTRRPTTTGSHKARSTQPTLTARAADISNAVLDYLLPRDGADFAAGQSLGAFSRAVDVKAETPCMAAAGLPGPSAGAMPDGQFGTVEMPNLPLIKRTLSLGLTESYPGLTNPANALPPSKQAMYQAALAACTKAVPQILAPLEHKPVAGFLETWMNDFSALTSSPAIRALNRNAHACSRTTSFAANSPGSEVEAIEAKVTPAILHGHSAQANTIQANGARVLVRCFGTVITRETQLLAARRVQFVAAHALALHEAERRTVLVVQAAETKYGVTFNTTDPVNP